MTVCNIISFASYGIRFGSEGALLLIWTSRASLPLGIAPSGGSSGLADISSRISGSRSSSSPFGMTCCDSRCSRSSGSSFQNFPIEKRRSSLFLTPLILPCFRSSLAVLASLPLDRGTCTR